MPLPNWAQAELIARESAVPVVPLITLSHPSWAVPQRMVRDVNPLVSRGDTYLPAYFELDVVNDDDGPPKARLTIPNVDRRIGIEVQKLTSYPDCTLELVALSHPDEPIYAARLLQLVSVEMSALTVAGELRGRDYTTEMIGTKRVIPRDFAAYFRGN